MPQKGRGQVLGRFVPLIWGFDGVVRVSEGLGESLTNAWRRRWGIGARLWRTSRPRTQSLEKPRPRSNFRNAKRSSPILGTERKPSSRGGGGTSSHQFDPTMRPTNSRHSFDPPIRPTNLTTSAYLPWRVLITLKEIVPILGAALGVVRPNRTPPIYVVSRALCYWSMEPEPAPGPRPI
jgi:hypothetical protein